MILKEETDKIKLTSHGINFGYYCTKFTGMKKINKNDILIAAAVGAAAGILVYLTRRIKEHHMLTKVSDEGYEIAHEILFPEKKQMSRKLHYGPVLPE